MMPEVTRPKGFLQGFIADYNTGDIKPKKDTTINYLLTLLNNGTITTDELNNIASQVGLTSDDFNNYDPNNVKTTAEVLE
jgi:hypothetical protein